ncbi:hypothetical protein Ocin01_13509 [Orchesella cincta]|uniref:Uncharacterized protein n=1 Tax=Orchesella cincta TaxID=48709 RepID=A0A1D2MJU8_ORCCI|nr:hypothetical protein Ocin01_13509 [Orchesella cincta]
MPFIYWMILGSLVFAALLLILFCCYFAKDCLCRQESPDHLEDHEFTTRQSEVNFQDERMYSNRRRLLSSRPSAPLLTTLNEGETDDGLGNAEIHSLQNNILSVGRHAEDSNDSHLVVGVHGNARVFGGYCVNLKEKSVEFYRINTEDLPWRIQARPEGSECEMKNLLFALMLWSEKITEVRKLHVYSNNDAIHADNHRYGRRAAKLLEHYAGCCGVVVNESRIYVNRDEQPDLYATYILPAEDLVHGNVHEFQRFVLKYYDISHENFSGTHRIPDSRNQTNVEATTNYQEFTRQVRGFMQDCTTPCAKCGYVDDETASMTSINRIPY